MIGLRRFAACSALAAAALATLPSATTGCASDPPSIVVGVITQMRVPKDLRSVRVVAKVGGVTTCEAFAADTPDESLPRAVTLSGNANDPVEVTVAGFAVPKTALPADACSLDGALVVRSASTHLVDAQSLFLPMPLRYLCEGVSCAAGQTCFAGACDADDVDPAALTRYSDPVLYGNTSFCISNASCLDHRSPVFLADPAACTFDFAIDDVSFDDQGVNIELVHDNLEREVVDVGDVREGFTYDHKTPKAFTLAPRLCDAVKSGKITALSAGVGCPAKTSLNPMCSAALDGDSGRPREDTGICTSSADIEPSPNAFYFLLDRSSSMGAFFSQAQGTLSEVLRLLFSAPLFRSASVALSYLPASSADCTASSSSLSSPLVPLAHANDAATAVAGALDPRAVLPDDPPLFLDGAERSASAYAVLEALDPSAFDHRTLMIVGNRDLYGDCAPSIGPTNGLAFDEHGATGIETGVIVLKAPPTTNGGGHDAFVDGIAIARAGFGPFADGTIDDASAAIAVLSAFDARQSCLYDLPAGADLRNVPGSHLTYFDLVVQNRIDIPFDGTCLDDTSAANGFNVVGARVRVCGAACNAMRFVLDTSGLYAIQHHIAPPMMPVRWSARCE